MVVRILSVLVQFYSTMDRYIKKNILKTFTIIITFLFNSAEVSCDIIPFINLSAGDVINGINLSNDSSEIVGKLFDDNMISKYVKKNNMPYESGQMDTETTAFFGCTSYFHKIQPDFFKDIVVINKSKNFDNESYNLNINVLDINESYANEDYTCSERKLCRLKGRDTVSKHLMNGHNVPEDVKLLANKTGVAKMRKEGKTYYVSSILKGYCLRQLLIFEDPKFVVRVFNAWRDTPVYISPIYVPNNNKRLETWVNNYLNDAHQTLFNITLKNRETIYKQISNATIVQLSLEPLPPLSLP